MSSAAATAFEIERRANDVALLRVYDVRTRADIDRAVPPDGVLPMSDEFLLRSALFEAACRRHGAEVCDGCEQLTISTDIITHARASLSLCNVCQERVDQEGIHPLPSWVTDSDLPEVIPALVRAFVKSARSGS